MDLVETQRLVPCVECGHDRSWHFSSDFERVWTDEEWEIEKNGTWNKGLCQWDADEGEWGDYKGDKKCLCKAFKHPDAPRRREAIEHSRSL